MGAKPFLTQEDIKMCFSICCCIYGIGTLGMPGNYARAGYCWASLALVSMASINIFATVCISKLMLAAPKSVRTFADLGAFVLGRSGRWLVVVPHMITCILCPIAFLVFGGMLLTVLFPGTFDAETWIVIMGVTLLPLCLIPTLKEGAGVAAAGFLGTFITDVTSLAMLLYNMHEANLDGKLSTPPPNLNFKQVVTVFGNLALAYGAGIVVPSLQREHSEPTRMPRIIVVSMGLITCLFLTDSLVGFSAVGCQIPGNLLFAIADTKLGFVANRGGVVIAYLAMQMHITIAFSVILFPVFYTLERLVLGIHTTSHQPHDATDDIEAQEFAAVLTPVSTKAIASTTAKETIQADDDDSHDIDSTTYKQPGVYPKVALLRILCVAACVVVSVLWKDHLLELLDFAGSSSIALSCMILPMALYLKHFGASLPLAERVFATLAIVICIALGAYVTYNSAGPLFNPPPKATGPAPWDAPKFPYCSGSYVNMVFTNVTYHHNFSSQP
ncbi:Aste57867_23443 [Aphanomyces stellatus]|uniref:Aste57867_23443 protein n=1 Tax=Aphanomyces stellatus TaxID=120398 RepID=A0A485LSA7_9STRA|nr:hypothetical protein As57867_023372 [Aphanomyces stellatus]VFU00089.1 Aste57867_23443 [Aphanomyces stellatus]